MAPEHYQDTHVHAPFLIFVRCIWLVQECPKGLGFLVLLPTLSIFMSVQQECIPASFIFHILQGSCIHPNYLRVNHVIHEGTDSVLKTYPPHSTTKSGGTLLIVARVSSMTSISSCPSHPPSSNRIFSYPPVPLISRSILCCHKITWRLDSSKLDILDCNVSLPILIHFNMIAATSYSPCTQAFDATPFLPWEMGYANAAINHVHEHQRHTKNAYH
jgi:hypothetical protein